MSNDNQLYRDFHKPYRIETLSPQHILIHVETKNTYLFEKIYQNDKNFYQFYQLENKKPKKCFFKEYYKDSLNLENLFENIKQSILQQEGQILLKTLHKQIFNKKENIEGKIIKIENTLIFQTQKREIILNLPEFEKILEKTKIGIPYFLDLKKFDLLKIDKTFKIPYYI